MGPFFTEEELGITNLTPDAHRASMLLLVKFGLNPIRSKFGPVQVTSGWRTLEHNIVVGGVDDSQHCIGEAADILCTALAPGQTMLDVFNFMSPNWPGQMFYYKKKGHLHISLPNVRLAAAGRLYSMVLDK
jgi:uncharacterized protein YcbK (DUF882 family)